MNFCAFLCDFGVLPFFFGRFLPCFSPSFLLSVVLLFVDYFL